MYLTTPGVQMGHYGIRIIRSRSGSRHPEAVNSRSQHPPLRSRCIDVIDVVQATDVVVLRRRTSLLMRQTHTHTHAGVHKKATLCATCIRGLKSMQHEACSSFPKFTLASAGFGCSWFTVDLGLKDCRVVEDLKRGQSGKSM